MAVSDIVHTSLTNAQALLQQKQMLKSGTERIEDVTCDRSEANEVGGVLEEK